MKYREFGPKKWRVSELGFGGGAISGEGGGYGFGHVSEADAISVLREAFSAGVNLFDTAPIYGFGVSEKRIGKAFAKDRDKVFIVSKSGVTWDANKRVNMTNDPVVTQRMLEQSLRDLGTDYIDLYMIHWPDANVDIRLSMELLVRAQEKGQVRSLGLCNTNPEDFSRASEIGQIDAMQSEYNLFSRQVEESLWPIIDAAGVAFMGYGTFDKGIITGRVTRDRKFDEVDARSKAPWWKNADREWKYRAMDQIHEVLGEEHSGLDLAVGFVLASKQVSTALCGVKNSEQLQSAVAAVAKGLPGPILAKCRSIAEDEQPK